MDAHGLPHQPPYLLAAREPFDCHEGHQACTLPLGSVAFPRKPSPPLPPLSDRLDHLLVNQASFRFRIRYSPVPYITWWR